MNFREACATFTTPSADVGAGSARGGSLGLALLALEQPTANTRAESDEAMGVTKHFFDMAAPAEQRACHRPPSEPFIN